MTGVEAYSDAYSEGHVTSEFLGADIVVANLDLPATYNSLITAPAARGYAQRLATMDYSSGTVAFYLALRARCEELAHHTVFLSEDGEGL